MSVKTDGQHPPVKRGARATYRLAVIGATLSAVLVTAYALNPAVVASVSEPAHSQMGAADMPASFADLIDKVKPAVVNISTTGKISGIGALPHPQFRTPDPNFQLPYGPRFEEFFRRFFGEPFQPHGDGQVREVRALGSGFIIDPSGYIVTNNHVVQSADEITVILNDGTRYPAELKGRDPKTDLALLKIEAKDTLPYVSFGNSDNARVGDWVVAIGNPFGLGGTATTGIVSARGRDIQSGPFDDFIQIDAPINRGNSGGPLFNTAGEVIAVNTAIFSPNGGNVGIGFAIPASLAKSVIDELREHGKVERGWLGVKIQTVTKEIGESLGLKEPKGALVASVDPDSPAAKAGVRPGDVIIAYNGDEVERMKDLPRLVAETKIDKKVKMTVWRDGKKHTLKVMIASTPGEEMVAADEKSGKGMQSRGKLGLSLAALTPEMRRHYRLSENTEGVLIVGVRDASPAAKNGLRAGDVIVTVGQKKVSNPDEVVHEVKEATAAKRDAVLFLVERNGDKQFVALSLA
ncbi:MAG: DegQ family serine endoprotease [Acidiferrobacterales bacterium]